MDTETLFETVESWLDELDAGIYPDQLRSMPRECVAAWVEGATSALEAMRSLWVPNLRG